MNGKLVFEGKKERANGGLISLYRLVRDQFVPKEHSHARENARRVRQMERLEARKSQKEK